MRRLVPIFAPVLANESSYCVSMFWRKALVFFQRRTASLVMSLMVSIELAIEPAPWLAAGNVQNQPEDLWHPGGVAWRPKPSHLEQAYSADFDRSASGFIQKISAWPSPRAEPHATSPTPPSSSSTDPVRPRPPPSPA